MIFISFILCDNNRFTKEITFESDSGILILNDDNFDYAIKKYNYLLVIYYYPWNKIYDYLFPEFVKANYFFEEYSLPYKIGKIDLSLSKKIKNSLFFFIYPTIYIYFNGQKNIFFLNEIKSYIEIIDYLNNKIKGFYINEDEPEELEKIIISNNYLLLSTLNNKKYKYENSIIKNISNNSIYESNIKFSFCSSRKCILKFNEGIFLLTNTKKKIQFNHHNITYEKFENFLFKNTHKAGESISYFNFQKILNHNQTTLFLIYNSSKITIKKRSNLLSSLENVGKEYKDKIFSFSIDSEDNILFKSVYKIFKLDNIPCVILYVPLKGKRYELNLEINEENLHKFIKIYFLNDYEAIRSGNIPIMQQSTCKEIVGKNFKEEVILNNKNILILFYDSSSIKKKKNNEVTMFNKLADFFKNYTDFEFAIMDMFSNEVKSVEIDSIPSIYLYFAKDKKKPFKYKGIMLYQSLEQWIKNLVKINN